MAAGRRFAEKRRGGFVIVAQGARPRGAAVVQKGRRRPAQCAPFSRFARRLPSGQGKIAQLRGFFHRGRVFKVPEHKKRAPDASGARIICAGSLRFLAGAYSASADASALRIWDWTQVMAMTPAISAPSAPRERSLTGAFMPCVMGP